MDPIATYIVARIRQNNIMEETEAYTEPTLTRSVRATRRAIAFIWRRTSNITHSIERLKNQHTPIFNGKEYDGFDMSQS
jgi:hypothetical protein